MYIVDRGEFAYALGDVLVLMQASHSPSFTVKDIIVRGGENISCTHVESAAYAYPAILDCAAVSLPDDRLGERVGLVCIPKTEHETSLPREEDILETLSKTLPRVSERHQMADKL